MIQLSNAVIVKSKRNWKLYAHLMILFDVHQITIENWIAKNDPRMTNPSAVKIFADVLKMQPSEILEEPVNV